MKAIAVVTNLLGFERVDGGVIRRGKRSAKPGEPQRLPLVARGKRPYRAALAEAMGLCGVRLDHGTLFLGGPDLSSRWGFNVFFDAARVVVTIEPPDPSSRGIRCTRARVAAAATSGWKIVQLSTADVNDPHKLARAALHLALLVRAEEKRDATSPTGKARREAALRAELLARGVPLVSSGDPLLPIMVKDSRIAIGFTTNEATLSAAVAARACERRGDGWLVWVLSRFALEDPIERRHRIDEIVKRDSDRGWDPAIRGTGTAGA